MDIEIVLNNKTFVLNDAEYHILAFIKDNPMFNSVQMAHSKELQDYRLYCNFYGTIDNLHKLGLINKHWDEEMMTYRYTITSEIA
jgi:hypothetical protein